MSTTPETVTMTLADLTAALALMGINVQSLGARPTSASTASPSAAPAGAVDAAPTASAPGPAKKPAVFKREDDNDAKGKDTGSSVPWSRLLTALGAVGIDVVAPDGRDSGTEFAWAVQRCEDEAATAAKLAANAERNAEIIAETEAQVAALEAEHPAPAPDVIDGTCLGCGGQNVVRKESWYTVTAGTKVGVFSNWSIVQPLVIGVPRSCFKKHKSEADARAAFEEAVNANRVTVIG